ncbi:hypothetical protein QKC54_gp0988 [Megavirus baoshan]|uniref:Uncharacterized protein n=1 Tax=Megavirus baoshan TaxID=2496520 RepID=A0A3Q8U8I5_9VIRU|nr:hypothetical protein QKC54_gp0988 [Megavirus baoshan]AZL89652.1 hypothetical protein Mb0084 [Megavirus baoshan]
MRRNSPPRFYNPGTHYTGRSLTGYKIVRCSPGTEGIFNSVSQPIFGLATVKIPSLTRVVTLNDPNIEGHVRTSEIHVEQIEKPDGTIIDDNYVCYHLGFPLDTTVYKAGLTIKSERNLDTNCNNIDKLNDHDGIDLYLVNKEDLLKHE